MDHAHATDGTMTPPEYDPYDPHAMPPETAGGDPEADALLADLTEAQRAAVLATEGPVLVLAAAGSGKTRVITRRIGHLVRLGVPAWSILALTFTNKAAAEMRERVGVLLEGAEPGQNDGRSGFDPRRTRGLTVATFHSLCARLLRRYADDPALPTLKPNFTIYDTSDQVALMKRTIKDLNMDTSNWNPRSVLNAISGAKNELQDADAYAAEALDFYSKQIARIYSSYERAMQSAGAVDFDDLLLLTARLLRKSDTARAELRERWQYLLIDEYQDTNRAQFEIAALLAGEAGKDGRGEKGPNFCVVGDPDQSIYGWRGADISNILEFEQQYPACQVIPLGENFRSTAPILKAADTLITKNKRRKHKDLFTRTDGGEAVEAVLCQDERHEAELVADWLKARSEDGLEWRDMAVFYRTNALSRVIEDALRSHAVPYRIARGTAFYDREEVKNAIGYLRVVANPADNISLLRIVNTPTRGIGKTSLNKLDAAANVAGVPLFEMLREPDKHADVTARSGKSCREFVEMVEGWTGHGSFMGAEVSATLADLVARVVDDSGLRKMYEQRARSGGEEDESRLDNLDQLITGAAEFEREYDPAGDPFAFTDAEQASAGNDGEVPPLLAMLRAWLETVALVSDQDAVDAAGGAVTLMTLHASKGLEFPAVAMIGLEEGTLPHSRARESEAELEEERRLAFVGITRAMKRLMITSARVRAVRGVPERTIPSRFLSEIGQEGDDHVLFSDRANDFNDFGGSSGSDDFDPWGDDDGPKAAALPIGVRVRHPQFGVGEVLSCGSGPGARARVEFMGIGVKTLILEYARLTRVD
ncbi:MAG: UvrD-helicase domain-containing protein [Phycisphaerales bacterium]|nr:UvrD-helicase domain-containing protein [Phycisphaerales bacterium]